MAHQRSAPFFSDMPVFDRAEYARAVGREAGDKVVTTMLNQHLKAGNIRRIARGVFASVPKHADWQSWSVDRFLAASRLRPGGVIGYHSALELHGYVYSQGYDVQVIAPGQPGLLETSDFTCRFVKPSAPLGPDSVTRIDRLGLDIAVTTLERTVVDLFDRPDLAGGAEELINSLDLIGRIDAAQVLGHLQRLGNPRAAGAAGWWLETNRDRLGAPDAVLAAVRDLAPKQNRYALGAAPGAGKLAAGWRVILPETLIDRRFEGQ
jgi:predicted transcriptional regulator of viral defense system